MKTNYSKTINLYHKSYMLNRVVFCNIFILTVLELIWSSTFFQWILEFYTAIIFIHYICLVSKYYCYVNLIREKVHSPKFWEMNGICELNLISFKIYVPYHIILKLIMFFNESVTFFIQNALLYDISNALKWTASRKKGQKKVAFYFHLNWTDDQSALPINFKTF